MSKYMVNLKINNIPISVEEGTTILDAAKRLQARDAAKSFPVQKNLQSQKWMQTAKSGKGA